MYVGISLTHSLTLLLIWMDNAEMVSLKKPQEIVIVITGWQVRYSLYVQIKVVGNGNNVGEIIT